MLWRSIQISEGLPRFQTSIFRCKFARKGRQEGENEREGASPLLLFPSPFPWSLALCHSSVPIRACLCSRPNCEKKRITWGGGSLFSVSCKSQIHLLFIIYYLLKLITFFPLHLADSSVGLISAFRSLGSGLVPLREDTLGSHLPNSARLVIEPNASAVYCPCNLVSWSIYHLSI